MNRLAPAAAAVVALSGCGDWSTEDLRFLAAVPTRADLRVEVPVQADPAQQGAALLAPACGSGVAETWLWARPTSEKLNASVEFLLGLVDVVRRHPPSWRTDDARGWGPFPDGDHPGKELRVVLVREQPDDPALPVRFVYAFAARPVATVTWTTVLAGTFHGASASHGQGALVLDFDALRALEMADPDAPQGKLFVEYDRASTPFTLALALDQGGFGLEGFGYTFAGYPDGSGDLDYAFRNFFGDLLVVQAGFGAEGQGRAQVAFLLAGGGGGSYRQCWDRQACLTYVDDPNGFSCGGPPCPFTGDLAACPAVPAPPF